MFFCVCNFMYFIYIINQILWLVLNICQASIFHLYLEKKNLWKWKNENENGKKIEMMNKVWPSPN